MIKKQENMVEIISIDEINGLKKIGEGKFADVYKNGQQAYKILKDKPDTERFYSRESLEKIVGIKSDICIFPNKLLQDEKGNFIGYSMDFIEGEKLKNKIKDIPLLELQQAFQNAEDSIRKISENGIMFDDLHYDNIMWNEKEKKIQIIDTDFFKKTDRPQERNMSKFDTSISNILSDYIDKYGVMVDEELISFYDIYSFQKEDDERLWPSEYIMKIKNKIESDFDRKITTLGEIEECLQQKQEDKEEEMIKLQNLSENNSKNPNILNKTVSAGKKFLNNAICFTKKKVRSGKIKEEIKKIEEVQREKKSQEKDLTNEEVK